MISSIEMREIIIKAAHSAKHGHIPSALSLVEIMQAYSNIEKEDDVMVFSKGHGCLALYSLLAIQGHVPVTELFNLFLEATIHDSQIVPSFASPSPIIQNTLPSFFNIFLAIAVPTAIGNP